jgi:hypothetical protein
MARVTREIGEAWVNEAIMVLDGNAPSRHVWSRWMDRALAPHATQMTDRPGPIPANDIPGDITTEDDDEPLHHVPAGNDGAEVVAFRLD